MKQFTTKSIMIELSYEELENLIMATQHAWIHCDHRQTPELCEYYEKMYLELKQIRDSLPF